MNSPTKQRRWIIIPVEVQVRDLLGRLVVAGVAASRGYNVLIGHDQVIRRLARYLPKGIMFDKALGRKGDKKIARYHRLGYKLAAFDEESTGFFKDSEIFFERRLSEDALQKAEHWFCISEHMREIALRFYPEFKQKFLTTGLPRSDAFRERFRKLYQPKIDEISNQHGKFILFNSNFGILAHGLSQARLKKQRQRGGASAEVDEYFEKIIKQGKPNLDAFLEMLPKLIEWFPDYKLVVRPHPAEQNSFWQKQFASHPNVIVTDEGTSVPWILASSLLVHHGCTTGIEAGLMNKPHIMYAPFPDEHHDTEIMHAFSPICTTLDDLRQLADKILFEGNVPERNIADISKWYANLDGSLVAETIVDAFDKIELEPAALDPKLDLLQAHPRHLVAKYWPRSKREKAYRNKKYPGTSLDEVSRMTQIIGKEFEADLGVDEVFPQLFHIHKDK